MNRLLVALLAAFDALIVVAVGLAAALAPLTLLWVFALGGDADWAALWPAAARVWQAGHLVALNVGLDAETAAAIGIPDDAASFVFSLAPLAFAVFTAIFAARSGGRAARAGAWVTGVAAGTVSIAVLAALVAATSPLTVVSADPTAAVLMPTLVFAAASLGGALVGAWREGDAGVLDTLRHRADLDDTGIVEAAARGIGAAVAGLIALGALVTAVGLALRGSEIIALFEAAHLDLLGVIVVSLGQLAYLPTLIVWGAAYAAGPGFALGAGTAVSPGGTSLGVVPGIPVLGIVPEAPSAWLLLLALGVVAVGALAGWIARARLQLAHQPRHRGAPHGADRGSGEGDEPLLPRIVVLAALIAGTAGAAALLCVAASGAIGPERLQHTGPSAGAVALAVAVEVALGAGAVLLAPRQGADASPRAAFGWGDGVPFSTDAGDEALAEGTPARPAASAPVDISTAPTEDLSELTGLFRDDPETVDRPGDRPRSDPLGDVDRAAGQGPSEEPGTTPRAPVD